MRLKVGGNGINGNLAISLGVPTLGYCWLYSFGEMIELGKVVQCIFSPKMKLNHFIKTWLCEQ